MCFGGNNAAAPTAPQIVYSGPSEDDIRRQEQGLADFQKQMTEQTTAFNTSLQEQIDAANKQYADLESSFAADLGAAQAASEQATADATADLNAAKSQGKADMAAAQAAGQKQIATSYQASAVESDPVNTQQTAAITKKKKKDTGLKIMPNAQASAAGTGLNIGV